MATIGLDKLYYAKITEDDAGAETYGTPTQLAKAMTADLSVELNEATLYADDGAAEIVKEFKSGTLSLGIDDIGNTGGIRPHGCDHRRQTMWWFLLPRTAANLWRWAFVLKNQRQIPLLLAVPCEIRYSRH